VHWVPYGVGEVIAIHFCPKFSFVMGVSFETFIFICAKVNFLRVLLFLLCVFTTKMNLLQIEIE